MRKALGLVGEHQRLGVGQACGVGAVQAAQELGPCGGQLVVASQLQFGDQRVEGVQSRLRAGAVA